MRKPRFGQRPSGARPFRGRRDGDDAPRARPMRRDRPEIDELEPRGRGQGKFSKSGKPAFKKGFTLSEKRGPRPAGKGAAKPWHTKRDGEDRAPSARDGAKPWRTRPAGSQPTGDRPRGARLDRNGDRIRERAERQDKPGDNKGRERLDRNRREPTRPDRDQSRGDRPARSIPARPRDERASRPERGERPGRPDRRDRDDRNTQRAPRPDTAAKPPRFARTRPVRGTHASGKAASRPVMEPMRIAKAMARAGLCSRREAERWIIDGRVAINGEVLKTPAYEVKPSDRVLVDGQPLPIAEPAQLWRYYKPKGVVTTNYDPQGRPTMFDELPPHLPRVVSVGRLDFNTEGLILLTNDGELARHLELPATGWLRRYRVRAKGRVQQSDLDKLKDGIELDGVKYGPIDAEVDTVQGANMWITVGIREGKNREVRRVLASIGLEVNRLIRISYGPFQILDLQPGESEIVRRRVLADQLGPKLAADFGLVDLEDEPAAKPTRRDQPRPPKKGGDDE